MKVGTIKRGLSTSFEDWGDQYEPLIVTDQVGNEYVCLDRYQAGNIAGLLKALYQEYQTAPGDWFTDIPLKIPEEWHTNYHAQQSIDQIKRIEGDNYAKKKKDNQETDSKSS